MKNITVIIEDLNFYPSRYCEDHSYLGPDNQGPAVVR